MAVATRRTSPNLLKITNGVNGARAAVGAGANFHLDAYETPVSAATAVDLGTSITLTNQIKAIYNTHVVDLLAHGSADSADVVATATAVDQTTVIALAHDLAAAYELHRVKVTGSPAVHYNADSTNSLTSTTVTTLAHVEAVMTDMKAKLNLHMASAPLGSSMRLTPA